MMLLFSCMVKMITAVFGTSLADLLRDLHAVEKRHGIIDDRDVRRRFGSLSDGLPTISDFSNRVPIWPLDQKRAQSASDNFMIIGD